jgi:putative alpha-1,2-mannosidase
MSAWYVFNILGFYPVCPVNEQYLIGSPCAKAATVHLSNGKSIDMRALNYSDENVYIQSMMLNGKNWNQTYIPFEEISDGAEIIYQMGSTPNKKWGSAENSRPMSVSTRLK